MCYLAWFCFCSYLCQGECSEHWRRLRDWPFHPSFRVCVCTWWLIMAMTSLHQQHKQQRRLLLFLCPWSGSSFSLPFPCCSSNSSSSLNHFTLRRYAFSWALSSCFYFRLSFSHAYNIKLDYDDVITNYQLS